MICLYSFLCFKDSGCSSAGQNQDQTCDRKTQSQQFKTTGGWLIWKRRRDPSNQVNLLSQTILSVVQVGNCGGRHASCLVVSATVWRSALTLNWCLMNPDSVAPGSRPCILLWTLTAGCIIYQQESHPPCFIYHRSTLDWSFAHHMPCSWALQMYSLTAYEHAQTNLTIQNQ